MSPGHKVRPRGREVRTRPGEGEVRELKAHGIRGRPRGREEMCEVRESAP